MKLLCKKSCWYEGQSETEDPFVIQGETYKVTEIQGDSVEFINALGYSHKWHTSDPEFHEYLEILERHLPETSTEKLIPKCNPPLNTEKQWSDKHYDFKYKLTEEDIERGFIDLDVYFVSNVWRTGSRDNSGALWHSLKTIARFGEKNSVEREIKALYEQVKGLARSKGVKLDD